MEHIQASSDLVIGQWVDSPRLRAAIDAPVNAINDDVVTALSELDLQRSLDTATGIWLDFIGVRLGLRRPATSEPSADSRFGFKGPTQSKGFDLAPFKGVEANDDVFPLPDELYRRFIKARAVLVLGDGSFQKFVKAVKIIEPGASVVDTRKMTIKIATDDRETIMLADEIGAIPRSAGVLIQFVERGAFGYDEAGVPFDQGPFRR